ncbi:MAG: 1-acyl-sn-glycerol-3-phosphate acyltransferase [Clostridia bacterium]|nr:1-acyl-sn-glycerol-3-phosphate acyltransferase [Clostridia bacterium]
MKIKIIKTTYEKVASLKKPTRKKPKKPSFFFRSLIRILSAPTLWSTRFTCEKINMEKAGDEPCLILMNHCSFTDMKIAYGIFYPKPFGIVVTTDALIGKKWLMEQIGCIPTQKFVTDAALVKDMIRAVKKKKMSVLMYPEAGYSFDGRATVMPDTLGKLCKMMAVPVVTVITDGAFLRDPLYNNLQIRKTKVSATVKCILSSDEVEEKSADEINRLIFDEFSFDNFAEQVKRGTEITEPFRADCLHRILYKCPFCKAEGEMVGEGTHITCKKCGKTYFMNTLGRMNCENGETQFSHIPDWYDWQRQCVREEIEKGEYSLDVPVDIYLIRTSKALYSVGAGRLIHTADGFTLKGDDGAINYFQPSKSLYTLNADFNWYEIGDVIGIGDKDMLYYCFPKGNIPVAKTRLATEEIYKNL